MHNEKYFLNIRFSFIIIMQNYKYFVKDKVFFKMRKFLKKVVILIVIASQSLFVDRLAIKKLI